jgi:Na+-driven multidrug efflux pump
VLFREITRGGSPSLVRQLQQLGILCFNTAPGFGDHAVAVFSFRQRVVAFAMSTMMGFGQGFQPGVRFNTAPNAVTADQGVLVLRKIITFSFVALSIGVASSSRRTSSRFRADDPTSSPSARPRCACIA